MTNLKLNIFILITMWLSCGRGQVPSMTIGDTTLTFYTHPVLNFQVASSACKRRNASLLSIKTEAIQKAVISRIINSSDLASLTRGFWTGGRRESTNSSWYWSDGTVIPTGSDCLCQYSQPAAFVGSAAIEGPLCLNLAPGGQNDGGEQATTAEWRVLPCSKFQNYICQQSTISNSKKKKANNSESFPTTEEVFAPTNPYEDTGNISSTSKFSTHLPPRDSKTFPKPIVKQRECYADDFTIFYIVICILSSFCLIVVALCIMLFVKLKKARSKLQIVDSSPRIQFTNVCQNLPPTASCDATPYLNSDLTSRKNESNPYLTAEDINNFCADPHDSGQNSNTYMEIPPGGLSAFEKAEQSNNVYLNMRGSTSSQKTLLVRPSP